MGPDVTKTPCVDLTDVTLADDLGVRSPNPLPKASGLGNLTKQCGLSQCQSSDCIRFAHYHYHRHLHCHCHLHQGRHHHIMMLLSMLMMLMMMMLILIAFALLDCFPWLKCHHQRRSGKVQPKHKSFKSKDESD